MQVSNIINLLKWDITINWKQYGWRLVGALGWLLVMMMILTTGYEGVGDGIWLRITFVVFWMVQLTDISSNLANKVQRIHFLALPASMNEKLVERIFICLILWPLALILTIFAADVLHVILSWAMGLPNHDFCVGSLFNEPNEFRFGINIENEGSAGIGPQNIHIQLFAGVWLLFNIAYGFMCGCIWTRRALLKSIGLGLALGIGFILITTTILSAFGMNEILEHLSEDKSQQLAMVIGYMFYWAMMGLLCLITLLFIWIGYHTYTTREVVDFGRKIL